MSAENLKVDVLIVGAGVAGGVAASILREAGKSVAVADSGPFGGTCPLRGCEPKKVVVEAAHAVHRLRAMLGHGPAYPDNALGIDWTALQAFKRSFTDSIPEAVERRYHRQGILALHGKVRFLSPEVLQVGETRVTPGQILLATGSTPRPLSFPGADLLATSADFLEMDRLPGRIVFVGGGYISMEFAHAAAVAGAHVTIVQRSERCLRNFDHDLVNALCAATTEVGVDVLFNASVQSVERSATGYRVRAGLTGEILLAADRVFHGAGRVPDTAGLDCAAGGVTVGAEGRIECDPHMRSVSNPRVWAAGDCAGTGWPLTPTASMEARVAARNMLGGELTPDYSIIPSAAFTQPAIARVGLLEEVAKARGIPHAVKSRLDLRWPEFRRLGEKRAGFKLLYDPETRRILGAHLLGEDAEETINLFALAMRANMTLDDLGDMLWAYPSFGYAVRYMLG